MLLPCLMDPPPTPGSSSSLASTAFLFKAPFPATMKQRRVSLAMVSSPRVVPSFTFRDDTGVDSHVPETPISETPIRQKKRRTDSGGATPDELVDMKLVPERKLRKKWTMQETQMLVDGCNIHGVGNWKLILSDKSLSFDSRSPVDLKDRFRTYFPDAYKQYYPNAKTHLSSKVRSTLPDGSSLFEKTRSKKRRPFTPEEDRALKEGYERYGTVWATIVKEYKIFGEQGRRSTDLRDRFRNAFPDLYTAAGYKPRNAKKKLLKTTDDSAPTGTTTPVRRRREALLRGGTKSVPQSTAVSEDEDGGASSDDEPITRQRTPVLAGDIEMDVTDMSSSSSLPSPPNHTTGMIGKSAWNKQDWFSSNPKLEHDPNNTQNPNSTSTHLHSLSRSSLLQQQSPQAYFGGSPFVDMDEFMSFNPNNSSRSEFDFNTADSSTSDFSLPHSHSQSDYGGFNETRSEYGFNETRSEYGFNETRSEFGMNEHETQSEYNNNPNMNVESHHSRGFTHHSNYAGDLIFGARTGYSGGYGSGYTYGLASSSFGGYDYAARLADIVPSPPTAEVAGIHPMQLLANIDETELSELAGITLQDDVAESKGEEVKEPADMNLGDLVDLDFTTSTTAPSASNSQDPAGDAVSIDTNIPDVENDASQDLDIEEDEQHATPPATPITQPIGLQQRRRPSSSSFRHHSHYANTIHGGHGRSTSVPPLDDRSGYSSSPTQPLLFHANSQPAVGTSSAAVFRYQVPQLTQAQVSSSSSASSPSSPTTTRTRPNRSRSSIPSSFIMPTPPSDPMMTGTDAASGLPFLDLHYYPHLLSSSNVGMDEVYRGGQALDLAVAHPQQPQHFAPSHNPATVRHTRIKSASTAPTRHQRGQSAVSPRDLVLVRSAGGDHKRKRGSLDGTMSAFG